MYANTEMYSIPDYHLYVCFLFPYSWLWNMGRQSYEMVYEVGVKQ